MAEMPWQLRVLLRLIRWAFAWWFHLLCAVGCASLGFLGPRWIITSTSGTLMFALMAVTSFAVRRQME